MQSPLNLIYWCNVWVRVTSLEEAANLSFYFLSDKNDWISAIHAHHFPLTSHEYPTKRMQSRHFLLYLTYLNNEPHQGKRSNTVIGEENESPHQNPHQITWIRQYHLVITQFSRTHCRTSTSRSSYYECNGSIAHRK